MAKQWNQAGEARVAFADLIDSLSDEQLAGTTLCEGWTPKEVLAHVVSFVDVSFPKFMGNVAKAKFNFDVASDRMARSLARRPTADLVATLRNNATKAAAVPIFAEGLTVLDATVHAQDVRRGLGIDETPDGDLVRHCLEFMASGKAKPIFDAKLIEGLSLQADDVEFRHGSGPVVDGTGEALMMALLDRPSALPELTGDGVDQLRQRLA
ncbi:MAG: maleylpyruvate isomerase family mycothiol-dependent enzyme [Microthrixaceae bacterium]|nr:maleylpyruvate isomerase family mycothiol-dependent enzyme [Microthrixaceae bacterium]